jgi:hypothetical protein
VLGMAGRLTGADASPTEDGAKRSEDSSLDVPARRGLPPGAEAGSGGAGHGCGERT